MALKRSTREALKRALAAAAPPVLARDITDSSKLYAEPRSPRGTRPANLALARKLSTLRPIFGRVSLEVLTPIDVSEARRRVRPIEDDEWFGTFKSLADYLALRIELQVRAIALRTVAAANRDDSGSLLPTTKLPPENTDARSVFVRKLESKLRSQVGLAKVLTGADFAKLLVVPTYGDAVDVATPRYLKQL